MGRELVSTMKNGNPVVRHYLRDIERRSRKLTARDVFNGRNPKNYVQSQASFVRTDVRRLARVLRRLGVIGEINWSQPRS